MSLVTEQSQLGPSKEGTVMLDIGGDIGALILMTGPELLLAEIEISRVDGQSPLADGHGHAHEHDHADGKTHSHTDPNRTHVAVRERRGPSGVQYAAIYPGLWTGDYILWGVDGEARDTVTITGGEVTQLDWR